MEGTPEKPVYRAVPQEGGATKFHMITVDEGWRTSIMCTDMYPWAAEWLIQQVQGKPYAPETRPDGA